MSSTKEQAPRFRVGDLVSLRYGPGDVQAKVIEDRGPLGVQGRRLYRIQIGLDQDFEVSEDDLKPTPGTGSKHPRSNQAFSVQYYRRSKSDRWTSRMERRPEFDGVNVSGVVGYSTARWAAEAPGDEKFAKVLVVVESDPRRGIPIDGVAEAKGLADQRFKAEHPEAEIEWDRYVS